MRTSLRQRLTVAAVLGGALLLTLLPPAVHGAIGVARNDDWDFSRSLFSSVESGHLVVDPWSSAMLWGHLIWAWPVVEGLGESRAALQVATALVGVVGLLLLHGLLRRWTEPWVAIATVAVTALGPFYPPLASSYMTDVPASTLQMVALSAGARALSGPRIRWGWWCAALGAALAGFTVREYSVAVLAGLVAGLVLHGPTQGDVGWAVAGLGLWVVLAATLLWFRLSSTPPSWTVGADAERSRMALSLVVSGRALATLALLVVPALPWVVAHLVSTTRTRRVTAAVVAGLVAVAVVAVALALVFRARGEDALPLLPGYLSDTPAYSNTLTGVAPAWMPSQVWFIVGIGSLFTAGCVALVIAGADVAGRRNPGSRADHDSDPREARITRAICLGFLVGGVMLVTAVNALRGFPAFDRYFLPPRTIPPRCPPQSPAPRGRRPAGGDGSRRGPRGGMERVGRGCCGRRRHERRTALVGRTPALGAGLVPSTIDAGYEWWGAHQSFPTSAGPPRPRTRFWAALFPESPICVQVSYASPGGVRGDVLLSRSARTLTGTEIVRVARPFDPTCSRPTPAAGS